jgi:predicted solute-binding protein
LRASLDFGRANLDTMIADASARLGFAPALVRDYFTRYIVYDIGPGEQAGLDRFLSYAAELEPQEVKR